MKVGPLSTLGPAGSVAGNEKKPSASASLSIAPTVCVDIKTFTGGPNPPVFLTSPFG